MKDSLTTIDVIFSRKSVRHYTPELVSNEILSDIVKAGMAAPTANNKQPWSFIIITNRMTLNKLAESLPFAKMLFFAPAAIVVCAVPALSGDEQSIEYSVIDCSAATQNILLAIEHYGLGGVWTAVYPREKRITNTRSVLGIPDDIIPFSIIPLGYSAVKDEPKDKWKPERIHWEKW